MIKLKTIIVSILCIQLFSVNTLHPAFAKQIVSSSNKKQIKPIEISVYNETREALKLLDAPEDKLEQLTKSCYSAGFANDIDPVLIATIIKKESTYDNNAISKKGYKSLMGTKKAVMKWSHAPYNVMLGACVLREKLNQYKSMDKALVHYKGRGGYQSVKLAREQLALYKSVKTKVRSQLCKSDIVLNELIM